MDTTTHIPPRSALFSQAPIGLGTDLTESLESFTCRLAREHRVARRAIEQMVNRLGKPLYVDDSGPPRLDSPTELAAEFGRRLATLAMQPDVRGLGLGRLAGSISTMHTLRQYRAWCGDCFCDNRDAGVPAHLPLVWSLADYQRCLKHGQVLETQCPCCGRQSVASNSWSREIDHCPWCDKDLARRRMGGVPSFAHMARRHDVDVDTSCSRVLGQFIAQISRLHAKPDDCAVAAAVDSAVARGLAASRAKFSVRAGLPNSTVHTVINRGGSTSITVLMRVAAAADVSMAGLLYSSLWQVDVRGVAPAELSRSPRLRVNRKHDWAQIRREAMAALSAGESVSLQMLARKLKVDQSYFSAQIGEVREEILERARASRAADRKRRLEELTASVRQARECLIANGTRVSARAIGEVLSMPGNSPYIRRAVKLARR